MVIPASTNSTNRGQAAETTCRCGAAENESSYAREPTVACVPITPIRPLRVAATARRTAGWMTSTTGMPSRPV